MVEQERYTRLLADWKQVAAILSDCVLMLDGYLANDNQMDDALMRRALTMADVFKTSPNNKEPDAKE
jgi:hypothetical protein